MASRFKFLIVFILLMPLVTFSKTSNSDLIVTAPDEKFFNDERKPSAYNVFSKEIKAVEHYLNNFKTLVSTFKQSNKEGQIRYGKLFIDKPGKIRCEYLPPSPLTLIIKDSKIMLYDHDLDEMSYTSSDVNSLKLLSIQDFKFKDVNLTEIERDGNFIDFTVKEKIKNTEQIILLTMKFSYPDIALRQLNILSEESNIDLILSDTKYNQYLGKELFAFNRDILRNRK